MEAIAKTNEDLIPLIKQKVDTTTVDKFKIKVHRRKGPQYQMNHVATFDDVEMEMFTTRAEEWLGMLGGGGPQYCIEAYHDSERSTFVGSSRLVFNIEGDPRPVDPAVIKHPMWRGPRKLVSPVAGSVSIEGTSYGTYAPQLPPSGASSVGAPSGSPTLTPNGTPQHGGGIHPEVASLLAELKGEKERLAETRRRSEIEDAERRAAERERLAEQRAEAERARLQAEINQLKAAQVQPAAPRTDPLEALTKVAALVLPVVQTWREEAKAARESADRRWEKMIEAMNNKPLIPPEVKEILVAPRQDGSEVATKMMQAMSTMGLTQMRMVSQFAEMMSDKDPEHPGLIVLQQMQEAFKTWMDAMKPTPVLPTPTAAAPQVPVQTPQQTPPPQPQRTKDIDPKDPNTPYVQKLIYRVQHLESVQEVVRDFLDAYSRGEPSVAQALQAAGGNPATVIESHVGREWIQQNQTYAMNLSREMIEQVQKRGLAAPAPGQPAPAAATTDQPPPAPKQAEQEEEDAEYEEEDEE